MADTKKTNVINTEETKETEKVDAVKEEVTEKKEAVEDTAAKEKTKAPEMEAPKAEIPHVTVEPAATKAKKPKKPFPWTTVLKIAGVAVLSLGCGFGGGYLAGQMVSQNDAASAKSQFSSENGMPKIEIRDGEGFSGDSTQNGNSGSSAPTTTGAALGVYVQTNSSKQVVIAGFSSNSTAETAGLATGDIITSLDGTTVSSYDEITQFLATKSAGDKVKVAVTRDGKEVTATVTLVEKNGMSSSSDNSSSSNGSMQSKGKTDTQSGSTSDSGSSSSSSLQG